MKQKYCLFSILIITQCLFSSLFCNAQTEGNLKLDSSDVMTHDTSYFKSYPDHIAGRLYLSQKFTKFNIENDEGNYKLSYIPNTSLNLGIGATYKSATLNLAYGFGFLNPDKGKGETKYLDMQFHSYGKKLMVDVLAQFYRGFYLDQEELKTSDGEFYQRPDLKVYEIGVLAQYIFNHKKFSYRSSFMQNEWQKKSAGSLLVGLEVYVGDVSADSTVTPTQVNKEFADKGHDDMNFFEFGPNVGYAHTFVIKKHLFIHGSLSIGVTYGTTTYRGNEGTIEDKGISTNSNLKLAAGYNSENWVINILFTNTQVDLDRAQSVQRAGIDTGNFRIIYAKRFSPGKKLQRNLDKIPTM